MKGRPDLGDRTSRVDETLDGTGAPIADDAIYFIQDGRAVVGNCGSWWAPNRKGYVCDIDKAGEYSGKDARAMADSNMPWPKEYVLARSVRHVRVDDESFNYRATNRRGAL